MSKVESWTIGSLPVGRSFDSSLMVVDPDQIAEKSARLGMVINLAIPGLVAAAAAAIRAGGLLRPPGEMTAYTDLLLYIFGAVALLELIAAFLVRRALFSPRRVAPIRHDARQVEAWVERSSTIVFALGASPMFCGVVIYLLNGDARQLAFFGMITLLAYRLLRPTAGLIEEAINEAERL